MRRSTTPRPCSRPTVVSLVSLLIFSATCLDAAARTFETFRAPDGSFEVALPGTPTIRQEESDFVWADQRWVLNETPGNVLYIVGYQDGAGANVPGLGAEGTLVSVASGALLEYVDPSEWSAFGMGTAMERSGFPGRSYSIDARRTFGRADFYLAGSRVFMVMVAASDAAAYPAESAQRVLQSFRMLQVPDDVATTEVGREPRKSSVPRALDPASASSLGKLAASAMVDTIRTTLAMLRSGAWAEHADVFHESLPGMIEGAEEMVAGARADDPLLAGQLLAAAGDVQTYLGEHDSARRKYREAVGVFERAGAISEVASTLQLLGLLEASLGNRAEARAYFEAALEATDQQGDRLARAEALLSLAGLAADERRYEQATELALRSRQLFRDLGDDQGELRSLTESGQASLAGKRLDEAVMLLGEATELHRRIGRAVAATEARARTPAPPKNAPLNDLVSEGGLRRMLESTTMTDLARSTAFGYHNSSYELLQQALVAQGRASEALLIAERARNRNLVEMAGERLSADAVSALATEWPTDLNALSDVARRLPATIVQYSLIETQAPRRKLGLAAEPNVAYIWVVQPSGKVSFRSSPLESRPSITSLVRDMRSSVGARGRGVYLAREQRRVDDPRPLRTLYDLLIAPVADLLPADPDAPLILVPQGELFLLPFAALMDADGRYLVEAHTLTVSTSILTLDLVSRLVKSRDETSRTLRALSTADTLIVGNPVMPPMPEDYDGRLPPLPGAEQESEVVARLLGGQALRGREATETQVLLRIGDARVIHLATHGLLEDGALAFAESPMDDGWLYVHDLAALTLKAELAVLSACDTGRGLLHPDGLAGLSTALYFAGVPAVVASLWTIPDEPTAYLMGQFYKHLKSGQRKAIALRRAMIDSKALYPEPFNWAAFTLMGDGR